MDKNFRNTIEISIAYLKSGGTIIYPTDTIWGIGCDATSRQAVEKIRRIKNRDPSRSMLILAADIEMVRRYVKSFPEKAVEIIQKSSTPVTIIYPQAKNLPDNLIAKDGSIGIRIPADEFCLELIRQFGKPIVSTSANISGQPFAANFSEIDPGLIKLTDYVVKWRQEDNSSSKPSSIYKIEPGGEIMTIRK